MFLSEDGLRSLNFKALGTNVRIDDSCTFYHPENISVGSNVRIDSGVVIGASASVTIGNNVHISNGCLIFGDSRIVFEDFSGLAPRVTVFGSTDDYVSGALTNPTVDLDLRNLYKGDVIFGRHVVVGAGSVILPKVEIGRGAAVGTLSCVRSDVPEFAVVFGNPARVVSRRNAEVLLQNEATQLARYAASSPGDSNE